MLNLIKYEFIKKSRLLLITAVASLAANILLILNNESGSILFISLFPIVVGILYTVDILKMYSDDLNKKFGYMLFMTPNSGYKIIVSKLFTAVIEGFAILFTYFIYILINGSYIIYKSGNMIKINEIIVVVNKLISGNFGLNLGHIFMFLITALLFLISFLTTAYTAMTIRKSIFSEIKFGGALSFLIFLLLNWLLSTISSELFDLLPTYYSSFASYPTASELVYILLPINIVSIVQIIVLTLCSGYLLEHKINL